MKVFIDTNVILDVLLNRETFVENSKKVLVLCEKRIVKGYVSAASITDIFYIVNQQLHDSAETLKLISKILTFLKVASVNDRIIKKAIRAGWNDFEDCVQANAALSNKVKYIITRNEKDYSDSKIQAINPHDFISILK